VSQFCAYHRGHYLRHGDANGRAITAHELTTFRTLATHLLSTYGARADVQAGLRWIALLLSSRPNPQTGVELARLQAGRVTSEEVLHAVLTLQAFADRFPGSLPDDARLTFALARGVLKLRKKPNRKDTSRIAIRTLGLLLREALSVLLIRLIRLHDRKRDEDAALLKAIRSGSPDDPVDILIPRKKP